MSKRSFPDAAAAYPLAGAPASAAPLLALPAAVAANTAAIAALTTNLVRIDAKLDNVILRQQNRLARGISGGNGRIAALVKVVSIF